MCGDYVPRNIHVARGVALHGISARPAPAQVVHPSPVASHFYNKVEHKIDSMESFKKVAVGVEIKDRSRRRRGVVAAASMRPDPPR